MATAGECETYAAQCKAHAMAMSEVSWDINSQKGSECFWSPVNGHLLVVASSIYLHPLLFKTNEESTAVRDCLNKIPPYSYSCRNTGLAWNIL